MVIDAADYAETSARRVSLGEVAGLTRAPVGRNGPSLMGTWPQNGASTSATSLETQSCNPLPENHMKRFPEAGTSRAMGLGRYELDPGESPAPLTGRAGGALKPLIGEMPGPACGRPGINPCGPNGGPRLQSRINGGSLWKRP